MILALAISTCIVIDGDTLRCGAERVRLLGIDAPELPGHCRRGRVCVPGDPLASTANLLHIFADHADEPIRIERVKLDRYGRTVAVATVGGVNLSCAQIAGGFAAYIAKWDDGRRIARECGR